MNSLDMIVSILADKHQKLKLAAQRILDSKSPTIREVAQLIGMMVSCFWGVSSARHRKKLRLLKLTTVNLNKLCFYPNWHLQIILDGSVMP